MDIERRTGKEERRIAAFLHRLPSSERVQPEGRVPLPRIDTCLDAMNGARWFSTFDLCSGYQQVLMDEESAEKTTVITREGTFRFCVMPCGLTGAPATFQRLKDLVMSGLNLEVCLVYLVDIIVFSAVVSSHLVRLRAVFSRLHAAGLKVKPSKFKLFRHRVGFLCHIVSEEGIVTYSAKVESVVTWPVPQVSGRSEGSSDSGPTIVVS